MSEKTYIIAMEKGQSKDQLKDELTSETGNDYVPARTVDVIEPRNGSKRHFVMALTDSEALTLRKDPRVNSVHEPIEWNDDMLDFEVNHRTNWTRDSSDTANRNNWGMLRHIEATNGWGSGAQTGTRSNEYYTGHLDGTGVDVVVHEGLVRHTHEQFYDADGNTRFNQLQWNTLPNMSGASTVTYGSGTSDHATHVLGTIAGLTVGWAPNAQLYSCPLSALGSSVYWFDAVKEFHLNKTVDPKTGYRRPTVVNMSWGYKTYISSNVTNIIFRGTTTNTTARNRSYGFWGGSYFGSYRLNCPIYGFESEMEELHEAGVIVCKSAGNQYQKLATADDVDYDNYCTKSTNEGNVTAGDPLYYNRGSSNRSDDTIIVGNMDSELYSSSEATNVSSEKGPRVDVWAAGTDIVSGLTTSDTTYGNYTGTSMASPQVAGMCALLVQMNPGMTPAQVRQWIINNAKTGLLYRGDTNNTTYFNNDRNLMGGPDRIAYWPYSVHRPLNFQANMTNISV